MADIDVQPSRSGEAELLLLTGRDEADRDSTRRLVVAVLPLLLLAAASAAAILLQVAV